MPQTHGTHNLAHLNKLCVSILLISISLSTPNAACIEFKTLDSQANLSYLLQNPLGSLLLRTSPLPGLRSLANELFA